MPKVPAADLINGFATAYRSIVRKDAALDQRAKALKLGHFVEYIYVEGAQAHH